MFKQLLNRKARSTSLITVSVSYNSNLEAVKSMLRKEYSTASNIKDKGTKKKVQKALKKLVSELSKMKMPDNGFIAFGAYNGV